MYILYFLENFRISRIEMACIGGKYGQKYAVREDQDGLRAQRKSILAGKPEKLRLEHTAYSAEIR